MNKKTFHRSSLQSHSALAAPEPQIYVVVDHIQAENISLVSGRRVLKMAKVYYFLILDLSA